MPLKNDYLFIRSLTCSYTKTYALHSSTASTGFLKAAEQFVTRHRKRALVVLVSNIREEDRDDLKAATQLLSAKHMVMVVSLREQVLD